tara:strand:+ start:17181 stop:17741 length:561 start_codon:yes stop_codon:yes gene_type:complete
MITSNADNSETDSPFYTKNESFCSKFEKFIIKHEGKTTGNYNAWSYSVVGKITIPRKWILEYKKSTFSSGNLLLSSKTQNLFVSATWKTKLTGKNTADFIIRVKTTRDAFSKLFNGNITELESASNYLLITEKKSHLIKELIQILQPLFKLNEIYKISNFNNTLTIELRTDQHYFDIFNQLNDLNL